MINADRYIHVMMEETDEQKALKLWKQFLESLTIEWMIENNTGMKIGYINQWSLSVYCYQFEITWDGMMYTFSSPDHLGSDDLLSVEVDRSLFKCLPVGVMNDFVRVVEL